MDTEQLAKDLETVITDAISSSVKEAVEKAASEFDYSEAAEAAIIEYVNNELDLSDNIDSVVDEIDFDEKVDSACNNYDFDAFIEGVVQEYDFKPDIKEAIRNYDLTQIIKEAVYDFTPDELIDSIKKKPEFKEAIKEMMVSVKAEEKKKKWENSYLKSILNSPRNVWKWVCHEWDEFLNDFSN